VVGRCKFLSTELEQPQFYQSLNYLSIAALQLHLRPAADVSCSVDLLLATARHLRDFFEWLPDDSQQDRRLSEELHRLLSDAGFTEQRAKCQQRLTDWLERVARVLTQDGRQMTGSYAEGWANSLVQVNGRTAADWDIDCAGSWAGVPSGRWLRWTKKLA
uniref:AAA_6 domain-containing protein n=1 Tax=Macrostomum lignano TaxID=282301 RepID=A0A1I8GFV4_9PLAT